MSIAESISPAISNEFLPKINILLLFRTVTAHRKHFSPLSISFFGVASIIDLHCLYCDIWREIKVGVLWNIFIPIDDWLLRYKGKGMLSWLQQPFVRRGMGPKRPKRKAKKEERRERLRTRLLCQLIKAIQKYKPLASYHSHRHRWDCFQNDRSASLFRLFYKLFLSLT